MERISSGRTFFMKKVFPSIWFGFLAVFLVSGGATGAWKAEPVFVIQPLLMAAFGFFLFRKLLWDLADEVCDGGSYLLVRKGSIEERIALTQVINVNSTQFTNPRRVTLRLRASGKLGDEVVFIPKTSFQLNPFARNPVAEMLIKRIDRLRTAG
jgi:hypothetical protein